MCGRFTLYASADEIARYFDLGATPDLMPRYNVAPSQAAAAVGAKAGGVGRGLTLMAWGLVPRRGAGPKGPRPINARADSLLAKPTFRDGFERRRCLIPATGFYEWEAVAGRKMPIHFRPRGGGLLAFAGLWDCWTGPDGTRLLTCAIITTEANELVGAVHDRMPAVLRRDEFDAWLDPAAKPAGLTALLGPYPAAELTAVRLQPTVNRAAAEGPECLKPLDPDSA